MASNAWGIPRTTHDLDFVVQISPSDTSHFAEAFHHRDYFVDEAMIRSAFRAPYQFNVIHVPSALKVGFWVLKPDEFEREMFRRRVKDSWLGETIWIATAEDVIPHKLLWNKISPSDRQMDDVAGVFAVQQGKLDIAYMRPWAARLGVQTEFENALAGKTRPKQT